MPRETTNSTLPFAVNHSDCWVHGMTLPDANLINIDLLAHLYRVDDDGSLAARSVELEIEYRLAGGPEWQQVARVCMTGASTEATRRTIGIPVPQGQYEVRVKKLTKDIKESRESNEVQACLHDAGIDKELVIGALLDDLRRNGPFVRQLKGMLA